MEDTMSSYSFSHQFYQRWTCAPEPIRAAITQELKDITTLLQNETSFESFVFNTHDLDAHVDELYDNHEAEQAIAKAITDKQNQERAAAEKQRLEEEQKRQATEEAKQKEADKLKEDTKQRDTAEAAQKEAKKSAPLVTNKDNHNASAADVDVNEADKVKVTAESNDSDTSKSIFAKNSANPKTISEHADATNDSAINHDNDTSDNHLKAIHDTASAAISLAIKDTTLSTAHQELIRELEGQIDDYLSEQMMLMSENLKSWLRAELTQHLDEQGASVSNEEVAKKNAH